MDCVGIVVALATAALTASVVFGQESAPDLTPVGPEGNTGIARRYPGDAGIAEDPGVIYANDFEEGFAGGLTPNRNGVVALQDPAVSLSGAGCAQITATRGKDTGGDLVYSWQPGEDQAFVRVYVKFHKDTVTPHHFLRLAGRGPNYQWVGAGQRPAGDSTFRATIEPPKLDRPDSGWHFYSYRHEMRSWQTEEGNSDGRPNPYYGNNFRPDNQPTFPGRDTWICVEWMVKVNTIGRHDGEMAYWIDGKKLGHWGPGFPVGSWIRERFVTSGEWNKDPKPFEGFNWRTDERVKLNRLLLQWYVSDRVTGNATSDENTVYFDNLVIARHYIGPMAEAEDK